MQYYPLNQCVPRSNFIFTLSLHKFQQVLMSWMMDNVLCSEWWYLSHNEVLFLCMNMLMYTLNLHSMKMSAYPENFSSHPEYVSKSSWTLILFPFMSITTFSFAFLLIILVSLMLFNFKICILQNFHFLPLPFLLPVEQWKLWQSIWFLYSQKITKTNFVIDYDSMWYFWLRN